MGKPQRSAVQRYHDRVAPIYDDSYKDDFWTWHDALTWQYLKPFLPEDSHAPVVDLGCGTAAWGARLAESGYAVTCVDISARMLEQARRNMRTLPASSRATFVQADLCDLSALPRNHFALALALGDPIGCTSHPSKALKEVAGILRSDGVLVATFDNRLAALEFYAAQGHPEDLARFLRDGRTHWLTRDAGERFPIHTYDPPGLRRLLNRCKYGVLHLVGKTVLPMRHHREHLDTAEKRRAWARIERGLSGDEAAMGRASHLQVACRPVRETGSRK